MKKFYGGVKKTFNPREPILMKTNQRDINNLWTGRRIGGRGMILGAIGAGIYGHSQVKDAHLGPIRQEAEGLTPTALPGTLGDMQDYTPHYPNDQMAGMGVPSVDGDLAFALHKLRHGGW